jgi:hypothetical protein
MEIDLSELLEHHEQETSVVETLQLVGEEELIEEDVSGVWREFGYVVDDIAMNVLRILSPELSERETAGVVNLDTLANASKKDGITSTIVHL